MNTIIISNKNYVHNIHHEDYLWNKGNREKATINDLGKICNEIEKQIPKNSDEFMAKSEYLEEGINVVIKRGDPIKLFW